MLAVEALRKARATMDCWYAGSPGLDSCAMDELDELWQEHHPQVASALLDGFSVDEVTAAEEALE